MTPMEHYREAELIIDNLTSLEEDQEGEFSDFAAAYYQRQVALADLHIRIASTPVTYR